MQTGLHGPGLGGYQPMSTVAERSAARKRAQNEQKGLDWADDRFGSSSWLRSAMDKIFPDHWSFMVGEIAMYMLHHPDSDRRLPGAVLQGLGRHRHLSRPLQASRRPGHDGGLRIDDQSLVQRAGRARHAPGSPLGRPHLPGRDRVPHVPSVLYRVPSAGPVRSTGSSAATLLILAMLEGFSGYSLPDDLLSGSGLRVVFSIVQSIPLVGVWLAFNIWGGNFPGTEFFQRLFVIHEFLFPLLLAGLLGAHLAILWRQNHTDFPGPGKTEKNIVGSRLWPQYTVKSTALLMFIAAVIFGLGGLIQINPIWIYGPYEAARASAGTQPDWYVGWLDGALRLWPHWEFRSFGHELANPFFPGLLLPGIVFTVIYGWPWIDKRIYNDYGPHNLLDRPRDKPMRTAVGVAGLIFFTDLTLASATDVIGNGLHISFELLIEILQYGSFIGPIVGFFAAYEVCLLLQHQVAHPIQRPVGGIIIRDAQGGFHTVGVAHDGNGHGGNGHAVNGEEHGEAVLEPVGAGSGGRPTAEEDDPTGPGPDGGPALPGDDGHPREP